MRRAAFVVWAVCWPAAALAHEVGLSYGRYQLDGGAVVGSLVFADKELVTSVPRLDADGDGLLTGPEIAAGDGPIGELFLKELVVNSGGARCAGSVVAVERVEGDGIRIELRWLCTAALDVIDVRLGFFETLTPAHRHLVYAQGVGAPIELVAHKSLERFRFAAVEGAPEMPRSQGLFGLFVLGIEHIVGGLDHLLFLLGLILIGGRARTLAGVITAFTVAHSVTLALAMLGIFVPSADIVEPLIALSVVYVAVENWFITDDRRRWRIALVFGLIHGFGFAGALGTLSVPPGEIPLALLLFNLGVEVGQLGILAILLPAVVAARRTQAFRVTGVRAISAAIAAVGLIWFVLRVHDAVA